MIIPILAFFFLKEARVIRQHILDLVDDGPRRALLDDVMADIHLLLAHYMRALVVLSLATFTAYSIFFSIMGVPYGVLLAADRRDARIHPHDRSAHVGRADRAGERGFRTRTCWR